MDDEPVRNPSCLTHSAEGLKCLQRKLLIDELCDISQGNFDKRMIMGGFNSGQLKQLAIELTSASEKYRKTFARTYGLM